MTAQSRFVPEVSVVIAEAAGQSDPAPTLQSVAAACAGIAAEVILVRPAGRARLSVMPGLPLQEINSPVGALVPIQWGHGIEASSGKWVACLSTELLVAPSWARTLAGLTADRVAGVAGALAIPHRVPAISSALHLLRFAPFLPQEPAAAQEVADLPGEGAWYLREEILRHRDLLDNGFWEVEFHRRFARDGFRLLFTREPLVAYAPAMSLAAAAHLRYIHGYGHGTTRVLRHHDNKLRILGLAPLVPGVLIARIFRKSGRTRGARREFARSLGPLLVLTAAWALGEARGALAAGSQR